MASRMSNPFAHGTVHDIVLFTTLRETQRLQLHSQPDCRAGLTVQSSRSSRCDRSDRVLGVGAQEGAPFGSPPIGRVQEAMKG